MKYIIAITSVTVALAICSCQNGENRKQDEVETIQKEVHKVGNSPANELADSKQISGNGLFDADSIAGDQVPGEKQKQQKQQPPPKDIIKTDWDKKIIKTAGINLEVTDYNTFYVSLREKVKNLGGYIAQEEQSQSDYKIENNMTIKVPVSQFDEAVVQFTANSVKINERKITSQDVTTEIVDTKSRMEAKKQVRQRYMELLNQAKNMNDILSVQSEINGVQEEIESATGRIEYLGHSSAFSTINLTYYQVLNSAAKADSEKQPSFTSKVKDAFRGGLDIISNLVIVFVTIWPLLLGSFVAYLLFKKHRRSKVMHSEKLPRP